MDHPPSSSSQAAAGSMLSVFVSYTDDTRELVKSVARQLELKGLRVFAKDVDTSPDEWAGKVAPEIRKASFVLIFVSDNWTSGPFAFAELSVAVSRKELESRILVVRTHQKTRMPSILKQYDVIDVSQDRPNAKAAKVVSEFLDIAVSIPESAADEHRVDRATAAAAMIALARRFARQNYEVDSKMLMLPTVLRALGAGIIVTVSGLLFMLAVVIEASRLGGILASFAAGLLAGTAGLVGRLVRHSRHNGKKTDSGSRLPPDLARSHHGD